MITPAFELSQDSDFLTLVVRVPYARTSEFDVYVDGEDFKFYAKPYFLRLTLPGRIVQDGREKASFDIDKGLFTVRVPKETAGQHFEGLQMLTSLLAPKGSRSAQPLVEEIGACSMSEACQEDKDEEDDFDWQLEQQPYIESSEEDLKKLQKYGFGNLRTGVFSRLQEELSEVIDVEDPENSTPAERRSDRLNAETTIFCTDHYLCELYEGEEMRKVHLDFKPWWSELKPDSDAETTVTFTDEEKEQMRKFTNRSYVLDKATRYHAWLSLVDIILAYVYDVRTTEGEHNVESAWTIRKISGTLSWLETYHSLPEVLVSFGRRLLCYPLYRHFSLITRAIQDAAHIFQGGKAFVLKCLLAIHKIFRSNEPAYILNDLYITDYCIWIQGVKSKHMVALAEALHKAELHKNDLELELQILEEAAEMVVEEEHEELVKKGQQEQTKQCEDEDHDNNGEEEQKGVPDGLAMTCPCSQELEHGESLIWELGERLEEEPSIREDVPQITVPSSSTVREGEVEGLKKTDDSQFPEAPDGIKIAKAASDTDLEENRQCNIRILNTEELDSDDEDEDQLNQ
ncbi:protein SHQ1 homolog isoform X1 [Hemibagrus wyckioides]|uniref:protein SHQ1 homolog isoform X1 n=2 Tax=Hemibagrus wyckioides TaxID=337641 RepID=UPI00266DBA22|nr:protein SHQ1 homolog isoform X1 [Hemibagrus wyckioides]